MKTLLTLFVLLFSSSVFAGDDLTGKKIYCESEWVDSLKEEVNLLGFNFYSTERVEIIKSKYSQFTKETTIDYGEYYLSDFSIYVELFMDIDRSNYYILNGPDHYDIHRRDLEIYYRTESIYPPETCGIIEVEDLKSYIGSKFEEKISNIKSKNKI